MIITYHTGELAAQDKAGTRGAANELLAFKRNRLNFASNHDAFLAEQTFAVIASVVSKSSSEDIQVWVTPLLGKPGNVTAASETEVIVDHACIPPGDVLHTVATGRPLALMGIDLARRMRHRISGVVADSTTGNLHLRVNEYTPNCPKYINRRELIPVPVTKDTQGNAIPTPILNEQAKRQVRATLSEDDQAMIMKLDTLWIGTVAATTASNNGAGEGGADVNHRGGKPGFIRVLSERQIEWPEYRGNGMFFTSGNLEVCDRAGVTLFDFETGNLLQMTGQAVVDWNHDGTYEGATRVIQFSIDQIVRVDNVTSHRWKLMDYSPYNAATSDTLRQEDSAGYPVTVTLAKIVSEAPNVKTFRWVAPRRIPFLPGQYATFEFDHLPGMSDSSDGAPLIRTWTLSETPNSLQGDNTLDITVKRVPGGLVTNWLHEYAQLGQQIKLHGVQGDMTAVQFDGSGTGNKKKPVISPHLLLLSAGIGITPSIAMIRGVGAFDLQHQTTITMIHIERDRGNLLFESELTRRTKDYPRMTRTTLLSSEQGRITKLQLQELVPQPSQQEAYVCGPASFMTVMTEFLVALGVPSAQIHTESFNF